MATGGSRFECVYFKQDGGQFGPTFAIYVDKTTGVNYLTWKDGNTAGASSGITPLLGADGKPVVSKKRD